MEPTRNKEVRSVLVYRAKKVTGNREVLCKEDCYKAAALNYNHPLTISDVLLVI